MWIVDQYFGYVPHSGRTLWIHNNKLMHQFIIRLISELVYNQLLLTYILNLFLRLISQKQLELGVYEHY